MSRIKKNHIQCAKKFCGIMKMTTTGNQKTGWWSNRIQDIIKERGGGNLNINKCVN